MTETEFLTLAEATLDDLEQRLESAADQADIDLDINRQGNVMELELIDAGEKIIVNIQAAMQEIWVAARSGGFHYRHVEGRWLDTRSQQALLPALGRMLSEQSGQTFAL